MTTFWDQLKRSIHIDKTPKRIISLVPSQTELLYDLGLENHIVGITRFCVHPPHLRQTKTSVGGTKNVHLNKIQALQPDVMLCNKEENTSEMIRELEKIAPVHISDIYTINDCLELIQMYGKLFSKPDEATKIIDEIKQKQHDFTAFCKNIPKHKAAYFIWRTPWMVAAKNTFIDHMLTLNNFENYYQHLSRYPQIKLPENPAQSPDLILLSSEPYPFKEKHKKELKTFFPDAKILLVNGEFFSWYGSRLSKAFHYFKTLHKDHLSD